MKIKQVSFGRTVSHNYQSQKAEVTVEIVEDESFDLALATCKALVARALGESPTEGDIQAAKATIALARILEATEE